MKLTRKWRRAWKKLQHIAKYSFARAKKCVSDRRKTRQFGFEKPLVASVLAGAILTGGQVYAMPQAGQIADGSGTIVQSGNVMNINQNTNKLIVDWQSFNIARGETVNFLQPGASSVALNRVLGNDASAIYGALNANGKVFLINPNGVLFGSGAQINVGSMVASTLQMSNADFMAGNYRFSGNTGKIINSGTLNASAGGAVTLISPQITNNGIIVANEGSVSLVAGDKITLGDNLIAFAVNKAEVDTAIANGGLIRASGGQVLMNGQTASTFAGTVVNTGSIEASSMTKRGGVISLVGDEVRAGGTITAQGTTGGTIDVLGKNITLAGADISASGTNGGGNIHIGGDYQGTGTLQHASTLKVDKDVTISADAEKNGNGGKVVLWSDDTTRFSGTISAGGGQASGDGGMVEVSGKKNLQYDGQVDTLAPSGKAGSLLLDPANIVIADTGGDITPDTINNNLNTNGTFTVQTGTTAAGGDGDITVNSAITNSNANKTLVLKAYRNITVNDNITLDGTGSNITLRADSTGNGTGMVIFAGGKKLTVNTTAAGGEIKIQYNPVDYTADQTVFNANMAAYTGRANTYFLVNTLGTLADTAAVKTLGALSNPANTALWSKNYVLGKNIDASATSTWNSGKGFSPIGNSGTNYTGKFDGDGHVINGLVINDSSIDNVGLFGYTNNVTIGNLGMTGGSITGRYYVGGLVGHGGTTTISSSYNTGSVSGTGYYVGGLVGYGDYTTISSSYNTGSVIGTMVGGLVGYGDYNTISSSYNTGSLSGGGFVGGLVSYSNINTTINSSYNTGSVSGTEEGAGGLVGYGATTTISSSYNTGSVSGTGMMGTRVGGLVGHDISTTISSSYNTGSVTGTGMMARVGGLVGNDGYTTISSSYNTGSVTGTGTGSYFGGLVGYEGYTTTISSSYNTGSVSGTGMMAKVGGLVGYGGTSTTINNSFWADDVAGTVATQTVGSDASLFSGAQQTLAYMKTAAAYSTWDPAIWSISSNNTTRTPVLNWQLFTLSGTSNLGSSKTIKLIRDGAFVKAADGTTDLTATTDASGAFTFGGEYLYAAGNYLVVSTDVSNKAGYSAYISSLSNGVDVILPDNTTHVPTAQAGAFYDISLAKNNVISRNGTSTLTAALGSTDWSSQAYIPYTVTGNDITTKDGVSFHALEAYKPATGSAFGAYILGGDVTTGGSQTYDSVAVAYGDRTLTGNGMNFNNLVAVNRLGTAITTPVTLTLNSSGAVNAANGTLLVDKLLLQGTGAFTLTGGNAVTDLGTIGAIGAIDFNNLDSITLNSIDAGSGAIKITTQGDITLVSGAAISTTNAGNQALQLVAKGGNFTNSAGENVFAGVTGKWQVYSTDPTLDNLGGISTYDYKQYNVQYGDTIYDTAKNALLYSVAPSVSFSLTGTYTKTYDGGTAVDGASFKNNVLAAGTINSDAVGAVDNTKITFVDRNVGNSKTINLASGWATGIALVDSNGKPVYGYNVVGDGATTGDIGKITAKAIILTAPTVSKVYDKTASYTTTAADLDNLSSQLGVTGDTVSSATIAYTDVNAGTGNKTVTLSGAVISDGNGGNNYTISAQKGNAVSTIGKKAIIITPTAGQSGTYNGTTAPTVITYTNDSLASGDTGFTGALQLDSRNAGTNKIINNNLLVNDGNSGNNYSYTYTPDITYTVSKKSITITPTVGQSGTYNGTTAPTVITYTNDSLASGDTGFTGALQLDSRNAGTNKIINNNLLVNDGNGGNNYSYTYTPDVTYTVTKYDLTVSGLTAANKVHDGNKNATLNGTATVAKLGSDDVTVGGTAVGTFDNADVGTNKTVTVTGVTIGGADANNYNLIQQTGLKADITSSDSPTTPTKAAQDVNPVREQQRNEAAQTDGAAKPVLNGGSPAALPQVVEIKVNAVNTVGEASLGLEKAINSFSVKVPVEKPSANQLINAGNDNLESSKATVTLTDGQSAVPDWLYFDEKTMTLSGVNVPEGGLPITVIVHVGGKQVEVTINKKQ